MSNSSETQTQISDFSSNEAMSNLSYDFLPTPSLVPIRFFCGSRDSSVPSISRDGNHLDEKLGKYEKLSCWESFKSHI
jgi:hypothetical protein